MRIANTGGTQDQNMFSYTYESREEVRRDLRRLNKILVPRGLRVIPLRYSDKTVLIYLYRIEALKTDLSQKEAVRILREVGYESAVSRVPEQPVQVWSHTGD